MAEQPRFEDYLNNARDKQLRRQHLPAPVRRVYSLSDKQLKQLYAKYKDIPIKDFTVIIDGEYVFCENVHITSLVRTLSEMGALTEEESAFACGKRRLPVARSSDGQPDEDGIFGNSKWLDLVFTEKAYKNAGEYFHEQTLKIHALRVYNSDPKAALDRDGEYFSFEPSELQRCEDTLTKISNIWKKAESAGK